MIPVPLQLCRRSVLVAAMMLGTASAGFAAEELDKPQPPTRFPVTVRVEFGPADKRAGEATLMVDEGSTPKDVASLLYPIESGAICCNTRELAAIDGVRADPAKNRWWTCRVNGSTTISPFKTVLHHGDRVEWAYIEQQQ